MSQFEHAADDGSFARSTGGAAARGMLLIAAAIIIGLVLMAFALDNDTGEVVAGTGDAGADTSSGSGDDTSDDAGGDDADDGSTPTSSIPDDDEDPPTTIDPDEDPLPSGELLPANEVNVLVANGTGARGVAGFVSDKLIARNYIGNASNAPGTAESSIFYREGYAENAKDVQALIGAPADIIKAAPATIGVSTEAINDGRLAAANIVVIIGTDNLIPTS